MNLRFIFYYLMSFICIYFYWKWINNIVNILVSISDIKYRFIMSYEHANLLKNQ